MMTFLNPPRRADSRHPIFFCFFPEIRVLATSGARGVSLDTILGGLSIEPFFGRGGGSQRAVLTPPPPPRKLRPTNARALPLLTVDLDVRP